MRKHSGSCSHGYNCPSVRNRDNVSNSKVCWLIIIRAKKQYVLVRVKIAISDLDKQCGRNRCRWCLHSPQRLGQQSDGLDVTYRSTQFTWSMISSCINYEHTCKLMVTIIIRKVPGWSPMPYMVNSSSLWTLFQASPPRPDGTLTDMLAQGISECCISVGKNQRIVIVYVTTSSRSLYKNIVTSKVRNMKWTFCKHLQSTMYTNRRWMSVLHDTYITFASSAPWLCSDPYHQSKEIHTHLVAALLASCTGLPLFDELRPAKGEKSCIALGISVIVGGNRKLFSG